jgi:hypothetical protein
VLLNTSFNLKGEPIVRTATDAVDTFLRSDIDLLVLGDYILDRAIDKIDILKQSSTLNTPRRLSLGTHLRQAKHILLLPAKNPTHTAESVREIQDMIGDIPVDILGPKAWGLPKLNALCRIIDFPGYDLRAFYLSGAPQLKKDLNKAYSHIVHAAGVEGWYYMTYFDKYKPVIDFFEQLCLHLHREQGVFPKVLIHPETGIVHPFAILKKLIQPVPWVIRHGE